MNAQITVTVHFYPFVLASALAGLELAPCLDSAAAKNPSSSNSRPNSALSGFKVNQLQKSRLPACPAYSVPSPLAVSFAFSPAINASIFASITGSGTAPMAR